MPDESIDVDERMRIVLNADYQCVEFELQLDKECKAAANYLSLSLDDTTARRLGEALLRVSEVARRLPFPN